MDALVRAPPGTHVAADPGARPLWIEEFTGLGSTITLLPFLNCLLLTPVLECLRGTKFDPHMKNKKLLCNEAMMVIEVFEGYV